MSETQYTADHEWIRTDGDVATIGITDFAQAALGDVVFVDLPGVGRTFASGEAIGEIESTKSVGELIAPAAGEVVEVNDEVAGDPTQVEADPGWAYAVPRQQVQNENGRDDAEEDPGQLVGQVEPGAIGCDGGVHRGGLLGQDDRLCQAPHDGQDGAQR